MFSWLRSIVALRRRPNAGDSLAETRPSRHEAEAAKDRGNIHLGNGSLAAAADCYRQAIAIDPTYAEAHNNLGLVALQEGREDEALALFRRALALKPGLAQAQVNCGNILKNQGRTDDALAAFRAALLLNPALPEVHNSLGALLQQEGKVDEALACFEQALALKGDFPEAHYNKGSALAALGRSRQAIASFEAALAHRPHYWEAHNNLGTAYRDEGDRDQAAEHFKAALAIDPACGDALINLGNVYREQQRLPEAITCYRQLLATQPDNAGAYNNMGLALGDLGQLDEAVASLQRALTLDPQLRDAGSNLALALLTQGRLTEGWRHYEFRFTASDGPVRRPFAAAEWLGESLAGKSLLIWGEQGVGDEILFASMFPQAIAAAGRCVIECAPKLVPLFARSFPTARVVPKQDPPHPDTLAAIDCQSAAGALARWLRPTSESFPSHDGYLVPDPARLDYWRNRLAALGPGRKVGFAWRSSNRGGIRNVNYTSLDQWGPIFAVPGVHFINLQYDQCAAELAQARQRFGVPLHAFDEVDLFDDLLEAAALTKALDLVIAPAIASTSLAGALGVPTWLMAPAPLWTTLGSGRLPWFPSMRFFPRQWNQDWEPVITTVATELRR